MWNFPKTWPLRIALVLLAIQFINVGVAHFTDPQFFVDIVPPYLPNALALVYISGVAEIAGGLGVLPAATRRMAGWGLLALLVAVYPANIHMALNHEDFEGVSAAAAWGRLPFQFLFAAWVWWATLSKGANPEPDAEPAA